MTPCISQVTTLPTPFEADLPAFHQAGFTAVELWLTKLETFLDSHPITEAASLLVDNGLNVGAAALQGGLLLAGGEKALAHRDLFRRRLDLLEALGVPILIVGADFEESPVLEDYGRAAASLAEAAELAGRHKVTLALEFQRGSGFCACLDTALALVSAAGSANLGVCLDLFHYATGPSKPEDFAYLTADLLAWVQVADLSGIPREIASDGDRILPGDGDFPLAAMLGQLSTLGYRGPVSFEAMNPMLWAIPADRVADAAYQATTRLLPVLGSGVRDSQDTGPGAEAGGF